MRRAATALAVVLALAAAAVVVGPRAWEGRNDGIVAGAAHLAEAARRQGRRVHELEVDTDDHSRQLLANHVEVAGLVERAVASCVDG